MRRRNFLALAAIAPLVGCGVGKDPMAQSSSTPGASGAPAQGGIAVGSANFTESMVLAELYAQAMSAKGIQASTKHGIGSREVYLKALQDGSIQLVPEYGGNLLQYLAKDNPATKAPEIEQALATVVAQKNLAVLKASQAADQDVYCVTSSYAQANGLASLADLKKISAKAALGGPAELKQRPYGPPGLEAIYGAKFAEFRTYDAMAVKVKDLLDNKVQVATFFTTDAAISDNKLVMLTDPQQMILPQQVIPLVRADVKNNAAAVQAVEAVQAALTTAELTALNKQVDTNHLDPKKVAGDWLKAKQLA
ncbi:glycine/betaine ABC transporter substrate-binding protein [Enemella dayhoffiae]|uniref:Glycine/betaine ABC transporter substrate-binding protein n=1 Tax=Enemella dayhoffiae TaxID=2016507 RepID=A0A255GS66_9ACTN|nr:ABC transporter substrate-binding protein [Enemella dayhoffiae]OYO18675.1 glycine/betaine ABC transporter substrate-binding protein [Enemella dayhoffiae]